MRVELDKKSIFALASDTRLEILKSLQPMRRTVSQLSEELKIDKGAVHRHLKKMEEGGLVKRHEDHGFVYYGLTWKARDLVVPNDNTRIVIVLSAIWILSLVLALYVAAGLMSEGGNDTLIDLMPSFDGHGNETASDQVVEGGDPGTWILPSTMIGGIVAVLALMLVRFSWKPKQDHPERSQGIEQSDPPQNDD